MTLAPSVRARGAGRTTGRGIRAPRAALAVWAAGVAAYAVAVLHRGSLGVAGVDALARFDVGATVLSTFVVVQLGVYAAMQVPVGVLLDRWGPRVLVASGALIMAAGQVLLALAHDVPQAYVARVLVGAGDAATFISVVRLVATWFPAGRVPVLTQLTGMVGHLGQLSAAVPLAALLHAAGWTSTFLVLAGVGAVAAVVAWTGVPAPSDGGGARARGGSRPGERPAPRLLRAAAATPGTWLGFWTHAVTMFPMAAFLLLWGYPYLTVAQGLGPAAAGGLMSVAVLAAMVSGPVVGVLTARHPLRRSWMVLAIALATPAAWALVLVRAEPSPVALLALLMVVLGVGGPGSAIGFDYARTFNPAERLGTATGLVNVGGFATAVVAVLGVGLVLDAVGGPPGEAFRAAFAWMAVPWALCVVGVVVSRRATRRRMAAAGVVVPPLREALGRARAARSGGSQD